MASGIGSETELFVRNQKGGVFTVINRSAIPGTILWVDSTNAAATDSASYGDNPKDRPLATLDYAIGLATASKGDVIFLMPGHAETLAATAVTFDKKGLTVIGLGQGNDKPTFTFGNTASEFNVTADSTIIKNVRCVSNVDSLVNFVDSDAEYLEIHDCEFVTSNTKEALCFINHATTKDYLTIKGCRFEQPTDPAGTDAAASTGAIYLVDSEYITIEDCRFVGLFETAIVHNKTTACKELIIKNCDIWINLSTMECLLLVAGATGAMIKSNVRDPNASDVTEGQLVGTIGTAFWISGDSWFGNDSGGGGQLQVVGSTATT
jgi:hypothetical protein